MPPTTELPADTQPSDGYAKPVMLRGYLCRCARCLHSWTSVGAMPRQCAGCRASGWLHPARPYRREKK